MSWDTTPKVSCREPGDAEYVVDMAEGCYVSADEILAHMNDIKAIAEKQLDDFEGLLPWFDFKVLDMTKPADQVPLSLVKVCDVTSVDDLEREAQLASEVLVNKRMMPIAASFCLLCGLHEASPFGYEGGAVLVSSLSLYPAQNFMAYLPIDYEITKRVGKQAANAKASRKPGENWSEFYNKTCPILARVFSGFKRFADDTDDPEAMRQTMDETREILKRHGLI